jgi:hypothetical protein
MNLIRVLALIVTAAVLSGCGALIPTEHKEQVAVKSAGSLETSHNDTVTKRSAMPPLDVHGWGNKVDIKVPESTMKSESQSSTDSNGDDSAAGLSIVKQPLWFKLLMIGVALAVLILVWRWIKLEFPAVGKAASVADGVLQREIERLKTKAMSTTDPTKLAEVNADIAHLANEKASLPK